MRQIITAAAMLATGLFLSQPLLATPSAFELFGKPVAGPAAGPDLLMTVDLNPVPFPPSPAQGVTLNLGDPTHPIYVYPPQFIELDSFSFGVSQPTSTGNNGGGVAKEGSPTIGDIVVTKGKDQASVKLIEEVANGKGAMIPLFNFSFLFTGLDADSLTTSSSPSLPCASPNCLFVNLTFDLPAPSDDPEVSFSVTNGNGSSLYAFSEVPEASPWALCAAALLLLPLGSRWSARIRARSEWSVRG